MQIRVIKSGSKGNCSILSDSNNNQIVIDIGVAYKYVAPYINFSSCGVFVSHTHSDHYNPTTAQKFLDCGISVDYEYSLKRQENEFWTIQPIPVKHSILNRAFVIYSKLENKRIFWATDLKETPSVSGNFDLVAIECNYDEDTVDYKLEFNLHNNYGYKEHLSVQSVKKWLNTLENKPQKVMAIHLSNSGNIAKENIYNELQGYNVCIGDKDFVLEI